jgi:hypothetical protein
MLRLYTEEIARQREWLRSFDAAYAVNWERRLRNDAEAAICEATARELLESNRIVVEPMELSDGGPDYLCRFGGASFCTEVTCIKRSAIAKATELSDGIPTDAEDYFYATKKLMTKVRRKTRQCSGQDRPRLLIIGTFHTQGDLCFDDLAAEELLTGTPSYAARVDTLTGRLVEEPYDMADLRDSLFIRRASRSGKGIEFASSSVSAVLLCAFSVKPPTAHGVLHPNPTVLFDRTLLGGIKFAKLVDGWLESGVLEVEWIY